MNFGRTGTIDGKKVSFVSGRVYPSTAVQGVISKRNRERPRVTPNDMIRWCEKFKTLPADKKPKLRHEHSLDPRKELGVVHDLWYGDDGWLHMNAGIYEKNKEIAGQLLKNGIFKKGISLSYFINGQYKDLIEISLTNNPDFEGAQVEYFHSNKSNVGNILVWPLSLGNFFPPNFFESMAQQQQQQSPQSSGSFEPSELDRFFTQLPNGMMVVKDPSKIQAVQQLAITRGIDPAMVVYQDVSGLEGMTEEQRNAYFAGILAENQRLAEQTQRQHAAKQQEAMQSTFKEIRPVVEFATGVLPDSDRDVIGEQLALAMATNPHMRAMGDLVEARMQEFKRLQEENEMLKKQQTSMFQSNTQIPPTPIPSMQSNLQSAMFGYQAPTGYQQPQPAVFSHSAGGIPSAAPAVFYPPSYGGVPFPTVPTSMSLSDMWRQMNNSHQASQQQQQQSSSSSSSPSQIQLHQHSATGGRPNAKRALDAYTHKDFQLFPQTAGDAASQPSGSNDVLIFAHSASSPAVDPKRRRVLPGSPITEIPEGGFLGRLTKKSTNEEVLRANLYSIISGERYVGTVPRDFLTDNLFSKNPEVFTQTAFGLINDPLLDNDSANIKGYSAAISDRIVDRIRRQGLEHKYFAKLDEFDSRSNQYFHTS